MFKIIGKNLLYTLSSIVIITFILNLLYYFNLFGDKLMNIFMIITSLICFLVSGREFSKNDKSKGYISGLKIGLIYSILFLVITFIFFNNDFKVFNLIYYILIIISSIFGGMLGNYVNKEKNKK